MKKITLLLLIFTSYFSFAQQVVVQNFDTPGTFDISNSFAGLTATIEADPAAGGTRLNGLRMISSSTGEVYQGVVSAQTATANRYKLTTDKTMSIDVYATQAFTLLAKVESGTGPNSGASQSYTTPNAWQTLTFNFTQGLDGTATANGIYPNLVLFPNWNPNNAGFLAPQNFTVYVDNITSEAGVVTPEPSPLTAAPTPPNRPAADVKSIFSDVYTTVTTIGYASGGSNDDNTYNTSWCPGNTTLIQVAGNNTNKITGLGCEGVGFIAGRFDSTGFTNFHMDIWTPTATQDKSFNFKFSNWSGGAGETNAYQYSATNANILTVGSEGTWISIDLPISSFTPVGGTDRTDFTQFVITSDLGTVYYDNLYLHKNTTLANASFTKSNINIYPNPSKNVLNISSDLQIGNVTIYNTLGQNVLGKSLNATTSSIDVSSLSNGVYIVTAQIGNELVRRQFIKN